MKRQDVWAAWFHITHGKLPLDSRLSRVYVSTEAISLLIGTPFQENVVHDPRLKGIEMRLQMECRP